MKTAVILLIIISVTSFSTVLVSDDFNDGNADGWIEMPTGALYTVESGRYCFYQTSSDSAFAASLISDNPGSMSVPDYSCRINASNSDGDIVGMLARANPFLNQGYAMFADFSENMIILLKVVGVGQGELLAAQAYTLTIEQEYWMRFELNGNLLGAKIWTGTAGDEPVLWNLSATDTSYPDPGMFALIGYDDDSTAVIDVSFDDIEITDEITLELQSDSWASIKCLF